MANQYVNKVEYGNDTLIDLTEDSVTPNTLLPNATAHNRSGAPISGSASASVLPAVDTDNILGGGAGASTNTQAMLDGLADGYGAIRTDLSNEVTARSTLGAHNLFPASSIFSSQTVNGLTYTVNSNDTVKINGTITTGQTFAHLNCDKTFTLPAGSYKFADGFATGTSGRCGIVLRKNNSSGDLLVSTATTDHSGAFTITEDTVVWARVYADNSDGAFSNVLVYPLLTVAEDTDSTFASFTMTNRELTPKKKTVTGTTSASGNLELFTKTDRIVLSAYSVGKICTLLLANANGQTMVHVTDAGASPSTVISQSVTVTYYYIDL